MKFISFKHCFFFPSEVAVTSDAVQLHLSADPQSEEHPCMALSLGSAAWVFISTFTRLMRTLDEYGRPPSSNTLLAISSSRT